MEGGRRAYSRACPWGMLAGGHGRWGSGQRRAQVGTGLGRGRPLEKQEEEVRRVKGALEQARHWARGGSMRPTSDTPVPPVLQLSDISLTLKGRGRGSLGK